MSKGLFEYAVDHPEGQQRPGEADLMRQQAQDQQAAQDAAQEALEVKEVIQAQLDQGRPAQEVLQSALRCISILTGDPRFFELSQARASALYGNLGDGGQAATMADRLQAAEIEYNDRLQKRLEQDRRAYKKINDQITEALNALTTLSQAAEIRRAFDDLRMKLQPVVSFEQMQTRTGLIDAALIDAAPAAGLEVCTLKGGAQVLAYSGATSLEWNGTRYTKTGEEWLPFAD